MANIVVTGLTAARMLAIEAASVVSGVVQGDNLILTKHDGSTINAGNVRGPQGIQGPTGSIQSSPAGGALTGNYPSPSLADGAVTSSKVAAALKDASPTTASLRTLGRGSQQAAAGNHNHDDSGWVNAGGLVAGDPPFGSNATTEYFQWRRRGPMCHIRFARTSAASVDRSGNTSGNFPNVNVLLNLPVQIRPVGQVVMGSGRIADTPVSLSLTPAGGIVWYGGFPRVYPSGSQMNADFVFFTDQPWPIV